MPTTKTSKIPSLLLTWSLTGKRGRKATTNKNTTITISDNSSITSSSAQDHDTAHFLLMLSKSFHTQNLNPHTCKTCGKSFNSYQALGGHRSSHIKFKTHLAKQSISKEEDEEEEEEEEEMKDMIFDSNWKKHECSICNKVFASGQALGGHKRLHWDKKGGDGNVPNKKKKKQKEKKLSSLFSFDLNLPPPKEEEEEEEGEDNHVLM
ncbi:zinc finger protein ZAT3-like [Tasmannia lanceolata]|uniref:zinc finger protein ZAT3-like n=1 Tax=Tasmannia lanceolata TaxID=3420 RepID=UPI0040644576